MSFYVNLQKNDKNAKIPSKKKFQLWINITSSFVPDFRIKNDYSEVTICIVDKKESSKLNWNYRSKKGPTNVLSFSYSPIPNVPNDSLGDLVMCAKLIAEEAKEQKKTLESHWAHLTIHGILHLLGYDHNNKKEAKIMEQMEIQILQNLGFSDPYETYSMEICND